MSASLPSKPARLALRVSLGAAGVVLLYVVISAVILGMALQGKRKPMAKTPLELGFNAEAISFPSADGITLRGWFFPTSSPPDRAVVKLHGLDSHCFDGATPDLIRRYVDAGYTALVFDFRSQGASDGEKLGLGWGERQDVRGAVDLLLGRGFKAGRIVIHGTSYGAASALLATAMIPEAAAVVADSPFADVRDLMTAEIERRLGFSSNAMAPGIQLVASLGHGLDMADITALKAVPTIAPRPIFFTHGDADARIPVEHTLRLKAASKNPKDELWIVPGAGHTKAFELQPDAYFSRVRAFLDAAVP